MKALWLREVQAVLERDDFNAWWRSLVDLEAKRTAVRERNEELLAQVTLVEFRAEFTQKNAIDALYRAGEYEDTAAQLLAEASEIENKSYEAVANFESQRIAVSDLFSRMGAVEHNYLTSKSEVARIRQDIQQASASEQKEEFKRQLKKKEADQERHERELREAQATYERGNSRKMSLWEEVEQMWSRSLDINLGVSERRVKAKRARQEAENLFREAEKNKKQAEALRSEAEEAARKNEELLQAINDLRISARKLFRCLVGEEFLYWPRRENINEVYCIPLQDHPEGFNIELQALGVYVINRQRGVEFIQPLLPTPDAGEDGDERIDAFFGREPNEAASDQS